MKNKEKDLRKLQIIAERIDESNTDITADYMDWLRITFACSSLGEEARKFYQIICAQYPNYNREECDKKFDNCLINNDFRVTMGSLIKIAQDHGIDTSMPLGRPAKDNQKAEKPNTMVQIREALNSYAEFRKNTWKDRTEKREDGKWSPLTDSDINTYFCRMREEGIKATDKMIRAMLDNKDFVKDFDPFKHYLFNLKPWDPDTDPDFIREMFVGHIEFGDPENKEFYDMVLRKWFVNMVKLWLGKIEENPIMPTFCGKQYAGKTYFISRILPPELNDYLYKVNPAARVDKDFIISISETAMMFIDEFSFGSDMKSDAYKYVVTSSRSNERDAWGHFREQRERRASLIAATNHQRFIRDPEGCRRYPGIHVVRTKNLTDYPLPYEGAYAQAMYLIEHGYNSKPTREESIEITEHNIDYMEANDCKEILSVWYRKPADGEKGIAVSSGNILQELISKGFRGKEFNTNNIGKAMIQLGFNPQKINGTNKYRVVLRDWEDIKNKQKLEALDMLGQKEEEPPF